MISTFQSRPILQMKDRIIDIMNYLQMKPSTFAGATNIKLATLSQILNGRNNPSLEVVSKIRTAFPFLSYDWIISGEGEMCKEEPTLCNEDPVQPKKTTLPFVDENTPSNPDENREFATERTDDSENRKDFAPYRPQEHSRTAEIEEVRYIEKPAKKIREIKIFYDDGTYETFVPQK